MKTPDPNVRAELRNLSGEFTAWLERERNDLRELGEQPKLPGATGVSGVHEQGQAYALTCLLREIAAAREADRDG